MQTLLQFQNGFMVFVVFKADISADIKSLALD